MKSIVISFQMVDKEPLNAWNAVPCQGVQVFTYWVVAVFLSDDEQSLGYLFVGKTTRAMAFEIRCKISIVCIVLCTLFFLPRHITHIYLIGELIEADSSFEQRVVLENIYNVVDATSQP